MEYALYIKIRRGFKWIIITKVNLLVVIKWNLTTTMLQLPHNQLIPVST